ncbi:MAG TPA: hypothetical protein VGE46_01320 [Bdellovibrio sp.]
MNKKHVILFLILAVITGFLVSRGFQGPKGMLQDLGVPGTEKTNAQSGATAQSATSTLATVGAFTTEPDQEKRQAAFQEWFQLESKELERSSADPKIQEQRLTAIAQKLNAAELSYLKNQTLAESSSANARILSVYTLSLAPEVTGSVLEDISTAPLKYVGEQQTHSPEEALSMQEKSLRRMALDSLFKRAETDLDQREKLKRIVSQIPDPALRDYAEKRLKSLQ